MAQRRLNDFLVEQVFKKGLPDSQSVAPPTALVSLGLWGSSLWLGQKRHELLSSQ